MNLALYRTALKPRALIYFLSLTLVTTTLSSIAPQSASAATITATGVNPSICNQTVDSITGVTAERLATGHCLVKFSTASSVINWTVPSGVTAADVLVVGGGGAGGTANNGSGGGGGGGQVNAQPNTPVSGVVTIRIGSGGSASIPVGTSTAGGNGGTTTFTPSSGSAISAAGGSGGASVTTSAVGNPSSAGFNGGGGASWAAPATNGSNGVGGFKGGNAVGDGSNANLQSGGGGGGSGGNGGNGTTTNGGAGGLGVSNSYTGAAVFYGGGGGGAKRTATGSAGAGGSGVGGNGGKVGNGSNATANSGGGGGGAGGEFIGGAGAAGIVVLRYLNSPSISLSSNAISAIIGSGISSYTINQDGGAVTSYSIPSADSTALSAVGVSFNSSTGLISGTTTGTLASRSITITATHSNGTSTATFSIVVNNPTCSPVSQTTGGFTILTFTNTSNCNWTVPAGVTRADILVVGGGGAGGTRAGGGGGAGGYLYFPDQAVTENEITNVIVGAGGVGVLTNSANNGGDSRFGGLTIAKGGGGGGGAVTAGDVARSGKAGGSGGGAAGNAAGNASASIGLGTSGQGFNGGLASVLVAWPGGGGGGSASVGTAPINNTSPAGKGGGGTLNSISGTSVCYATGGGGGTSVGYTAGAAGDCAGTASPNGGAGTSGSITPATPTANTGAGGGGSGWSAGADLVGGNGANGVVIVRYAMPAVSITTPTTGLTGTLGSAYSLTLSKSGGSGSGTFSIASGSLPAGVTLNTSTGVISGTPTATGTFAITARFTDSNTSVATTSPFSIVIATVPASPTLSTVTVTDSTTVSIPFTAGAANGSAITAYTITSSPSIALTYSGTSTPFTVTGAFVAGQAYTFTMTATNGVGASISSSASNSVTPLGTYTITYSYNNATSGNSDATSTFIIGGSAITLPTPIRTNFTFEGWYSLSSGGVLVGAAGAALTPTQSRTLHARWTQNSLYGIAPESLTLFGTVTSTGGIDVDVAGRNATSRVAATVPAGSLPIGTVINFHLVGDFTRAQSLIGANKNYIVSMVVSWLAPDGTVPDTEPGKEISVTVTNNSIKAGASIYAIINGVSTLLTTATVDGSVTFLLASDPEIVIVAPALDTPTVTAKATSGQVKSIDLSWPAIANRTSYTVKIYNAAGTTLLESIESITATSLTITSSNYAGLAEKSGYRFSVTAIADGINYSNSIESTKAIAATGSLSISGNVFEANTVTAITSNLPSGSYTYQWLGGSDTSTLTAISAAITSTYTPAIGDRSHLAQMYLAARVIATIDGATYTFTSAASPVYTYPNANGGSVNSAFPAIAGTYTPGQYRVGQSVVGHPWEIYGTPWPTLNYQWWICNSEAATANPASLCSQATGAGASGTSTHLGNANALDLGNYDFSYIVPAAASGKYLTFTATLTNAATTLISTPYTFRIWRGWSSGVILP